MIERMMALTRYMEKQPGVTDADLDALVAQLHAILPAEFCPITLPEDYRAFMRATNGASGSMGEIDPDTTGDEYAELDPGGGAYLTIHTVQEIVREHEMWTATRLFPEMLLFAGIDGDYYGFDMRFRPMPVVFCDHGSGEVMRYYGASFRAFVEHAGSPRWLEQEPGHEAYFQAARDCRSMVPGAVQLLPQSCISPGSVQVAEADATPVLHHVLPEERRASPDERTSYTGTGANPNPAPPDRTLHFPSTGSLGLLFIRLWDSAEPWTRLGPATGVVSVPAGMDELCYHHARCISNGLQLSRHQ